MAKEFQQPVAAGDPEPEQSDMGASKINYGEQRYGWGISDEEPMEYCEPGDEGKAAVDCIQSAGGISSHSTSEQ